jgi:hypothetical protein
MEYLGMLRADKAAGSFTIHSSPRLVDSGYNASSQQQIDHQGRLAALVIPLGPKSVN